MRLDRRRLVWTNATTNPTAEWIALQITEAFPWDQAPRYLLRDRDKVLRGNRPSPIASHGNPRPSDRTVLAVAEWPCRTAHRIDLARVLDHIVVSGEASLRRTLRAYARYYNEVRTHRSLDKDTPEARPIQFTGSIYSRPVLGGLHHHYVRV